MKCIVVSATILVSPKWNEEMVENKRSIFASIMKGHGFNIVSTTIGEVDLVNLKQKAGHD